MRYNILIIHLLCLIKVSFAQEILMDNSYHFSFILPSDWTYQKFDSSNSFIRFECYNRDSTAVLEFYAIKSNNSIDLYKFSNFITSEGILGKSLGQFQDSSKVFINGMTAIKKDYFQKTRRGRRINIQASMLVKENFGYSIVARWFTNAEQPEIFTKIVESMTIKLPRSTLSWLFLLGLVGICFYGLGLGVTRTLKWFGPFNRRSITICAIVVLVCLTCLFLTFLFFEKINILMCLVAGGLLFWGITMLPDANPVINEYNKVKMNNTAGAYRAFCQQHKSSIRYYNDARSRMNALMDDVVKKYNNLVSELNTPIVRAALAMFEFIKKTDNFQVGVQYKAHNHVQDFTEQAKIERNWTVLPANPAFTEAKNRSREESITGLINYAFRQITPEDILSFSMVKKSTPNWINFEITYIISNSGALYYYIKDKDLSDDKKTWFTGVEFKWLLEIKIPDNLELFRLLLESKPTEQFQTQGNTSDSVYDAMADSAFRDFCRVFIEQSGLMSAIDKRLKIN